MKTRKIIMTISAVVMTGMLANAALTQPSGLTVLNDWNFNGDGAVGGTVDSGSSATDWINNNTASTISSMGLDSVNSYFTTNGANDRLFVDTASGSGELQFITDGTGVQKFKLGLGAVATSGFFEMSGKFAKTAGTGTTVNTRLSFQDAANNELFQLHINKHNRLRLNVGGTDVVDTTLSTAGIKDGFNTYQVGWDNGLIGLYFGDEGGLGTETIDTGITLAGSTAVSHIQFISGKASGTHGYTNQIESMSVAAIPEPATMGLVGVFAGATLFIRRRFMAN